MELNSDFKKFTLRLLLAWISLSVLFAIGGYLIFQNAQKKTKEEKYHEIAAISQLKINEIAQWREEQLGDAQILSGNQSLISDLKSHFTRENNGLDHIKILNNLLIFESAYKYQNITVVDKDLNMRFSTRTNDAIDKNDRSYIQNSILSKQIIFTDLYKGSDGKPRLKIIVPLVLTTEKELIGALVLSIDPATFLFPLIRLWPGPSKTAETLILRKEGDHVLFLNELRHKKNTALNFQIPLSQIEIPAVQAVLGKTGLFEGIDYRGVRVLSCLAAIPGTNWLMVAKVDEDEIYESITQQGIYRFSFVFILVVLIGISTLIFRKQQEKHLRKQYLAELDRLALQKHFEYISKYANDIIILSGGDGKIIEVNDAAIHTYGYSKEEILNMSILDLDSADSHSIFFQAKDKVADQNRVLFETIHQRKDGTKFNAEISSRIIEIEGREYSQSIIRNITERKRFEIREHNRSRILEYIVEGTRLPVILNFIVSTVETEDPASICSIHLLDAEGKHLLHGAAPGLPAVYNQAMDGIEVGEGVGACGSAAYTRKRVIVSDMLTHPYWIPYKELVQQAGLKSCWSEPIMSSDNKVLGTFTIYNRDSKLPDQEDFNHLKTALDFASLAIERAQTEAEIIKHREHLEELVEERTLALKESEERFRIFFNSGSDIIFVSGLNENGLGNFIASNDIASEKLGYTRDELLKMSAYD
jgi:PAS domain S-box-containing protein